MNKMRTLIYLLIFAAFCFVGYGYFELRKERNDLSHTVVSLKEQKQNLMGELKKQREITQQLSRKNQRLKNNAQAAYSRLVDLFMESDISNALIQELKEGATLLKMENEDLRNKNKDLQLSFSLFAEENEALKARFGSIKELKKAIKELKARKRKIISPFLFSRPSSDTDLHGNLGFLLKDGLSTFRADKVRIEVVPAKVSQ